MFISGEQDQTHSYTIQSVPCSRDQTWMQIYLMKRPVIIRMSYVLTRKAEVLYVSLGALIFLYHYIFTAILYLLSFPNRLENLAAWHWVYARCFLTRKTKPTNDDDHMLILDLSDIPSDYLPTDTCQIH